MTSMPVRLPVTTEQLIEELDKLNPPPTVDGPLDEKMIQELVFLAGRRSVIDELIRIQIRSEHEAGGY